MAVNLPIRLSLTGQRQVRQELRGMGRDGERAVKRFQRATAQGNKTLLVFDRGIRQVGDSAAGFAASLGIVGRALQALGPVGTAAAVGIGGVVLALEKGTRPAIEFADAIDKAAETAGIGAERLQELRFVNERFGLSARETDEALRRFNRRIGEAAGGNEEYLKVLEKLEIELRGQNDQLKSQEQLYDEVDDAIDRFASSAEQAAIASRLFGEDAGPKLAVALRASREEIEKIAQEGRDLGAVLDEELIQRGVVAQDQLASLARIIDTQLAAAFIDLAPILIDFTELLADGARALATFADLFRDQSDQGTRSLETQLAAANEELLTLRERIDGIRGNFDVPQSLLEKEIALLTEIGEIRTELARREQERLRPPGGGGGSPLEVEIVRERTALEDYIASLEDAAEAEQLEGVAKAELIALIRAEDLARKDVNDEKRKSAELTAAETARIEAAVAVREQARTLRQEENALDREAEQLRKSLLTDQEQLNQTVARYQTLLDSGRISQEQFDLAVAQTTESLVDSNLAVESLGRSVTSLARTAISDFDSIGEAATRLAFQLAETAASAGFNFLGGQGTGFLSGLFGPGAGAGAGAGVSPTVIGSGSLQGVFLERGGKVDGSAPTRRVPASTFIGAPSFQDGGVVPALLHRGERVLNARETAAYDRGMTLNVTVVNETGTPATAEARQQPNGDVLVVLRRQVDRDIRNGEFDGAFRQRYGSAQVLAQR